MFGTAAATLESDVVWSIVTANPTMGDALRHAARSARLARVIASTCAARSGARSSKPKSR